MTSTYSTLHAGQCKTYKCCYGHMTTLTYIRRSITVTVEAGPYPAARVQRNLLLHTDVAAHCKLLTLNMHTPELQTEHRVHLQSEHLLPGIRHYRSTRTWQKHEQTVVAYCWDDWFWCAESAKFGGTVATSVTIAVTCLGDRWTTTGIAAACRYSARMWRHTSLCLLLSIVAIAHWWACVRMRWKDCTLLYTDDCSSASYDTCLRLLSWHICCFCFFEL